MKIKTEVLSVRIPKTNKFFLKEIAKEKGKDLSKLVNEILEDYLKENEFKLDFQAGLW